MKATPRKDTKRQGQLYDMAQGTRTPKRPRKRATAATGAPPDRPKTIAIGQIEFHPTFADLLLIVPDTLENITESMRVGGFWESHPIVLGWWPGLEEPVLIDGKTRMQAALGNGIREVPYMIKEFDGEVQALHYVVRSQVARRTTTDGALYRLCEQYDRLLERGGDRRSEEPNQC